MTEPYDSSTHDATVETVEIRIKGRLDPAAFAEFVTHYARRLDIDGGCRMSDADTLTIMVKGRRALIEMLATACMLGPARSFVQDIEVDRHSDEAIPSPAKPRAPDTY